MIAALFVIKNGPYFGIDDVDPWDESRDARNYVGPHPVVAHPPCARWGHYWHGSPSHHKRFKKGDDGGCFEAALAFVNKYGGVLEHPAHSFAWYEFGLDTPPKRGGWIKAGLWQPGWTCHVEQGHYGHLAKKPTWLYAHRVELPELIWGVSGAEYHMSAMSATKLQRAGRMQQVEHLLHSARSRTPDEFRDLLLDMARSVPL